MWTDMAAVQSLSNRGDAQETVLEPHLLCRPPPRPRVCRGSARGVQTLQKGVQQATAGRGALLVLAPFPAASLPAAQAERQQAISTARPASEHNSSKTMPTEPGPGLAKSRNL